MTLHLVDKETETAVARPLSTLIPLIKEAVADERRADTEERREVGKLLLEAQQRMKDDGTFFRKRGPGSGIGGPGHPGAGEVRR